MAFGTNLQYLRKQLGGMTQEQLAEKLDVSRQTVSKWEMDEAYPEVAKLLELCDVFSCKLDALLREDLTEKPDVFSDVRIELVKGFTMARYVMITPNPEDDVIAYMDAWARKNGLMDIPGSAVKRIGWDFPFVSPEQQNRFGLRGYAAAYILPDGFEPTCPGAEIAKQEDARYAIMRVREPMAAPFERIPGAYKRILDYLGANGFKESVHRDVLACFEHVFTQNGVEYMDVYIHVDSVGKGNLHTTI